MTDTSAGHLRTREPAAPHIRDVAAASAPGPPPTFGLLEQVLGAVDAFVYAKDAGGRFVYANPALAAFFGRPAAEIVGLTDDAFHPPEAARAIRANDAAAMAAGRAVETREATEVPGPAGPERRTFLSRKAPLLDAQGRPAGVVGVTTDVTAQVHAEEVLRASEARQRFLLALNDQLRSLADPAAIQAAGAELLGAHLGASRVQYGEVLADDDTATWAGGGSPSADDAVFVVRREYRREAMPNAVGRYRFADFGAFVAEAFRAGCTLAVPDVRARPDLSPAEQATYAAVGLVAFLAVPLVKGGRIVAYLGVHQTAPRAWTADEVALVEAVAARLWDAVERARADAAARASERRVRRLFEANVVGVMVADTAGRILDANDAVLALLGYERAALEAGALRWDVITPPGWKQTDQQIADELLRTGVAAPTEKEYRAADGRLIPVLIGGALLDPADGYGAEGSGAALPGPAPAAVVFVVDLTERKRAEAEVRRLNADLERQVAERTRDLREANAELEAFTYTVSHDLRAPLRALQGFAAALDEDYGDRLDAEGREYTTFLTRAARQMDQLIADLLAFSRLGRAEVRDTVVDLGAAVAEAREQVRAELAAAGADLTIAAPLPAVRGDHRLVVQAVANLLSNAAKFVTPGGRPTVRVYAEPSAASASAGRVRLVVEDRGIGVSVEHHERVFRVFERLHSGEEYPGTGIGLAIVRRAAERMGGATGVDPTPGGGSRFWLELVAADAPPPADLPGSAAPAVS